MTEPNHTQPANTTDLAPAKPKRLMRRYTEEDVQRGLTQLALCNGNHAHAHDDLATQGHDIPAETLRSWAKNQHAHQYEQIRSDLVPRIHARIATQHEDVARQALEAQALAIQLTHQQLASGNAKQPSTIARDLGTVAGISTDKANLQRGRPTHITEHRDIAGILRSLEANIPGVQPADADTTATEIPTSDNGSENRESEAHNRVSC